MHPNNVIIQAWKPIEKTCVLHESILKIFSFQPEPSECCLRHPSSSFGITKEYFGFCRDTAQRSRFTAVIVPKCHR